MKAESYRTCMRLNKRKRRCSGYTVGDPAHVTISRGYGSICVWEGQPSDGECEGYKKEDKHD